MEQWCSESLKQLIWWTEVKNWNKNKYVNEKTKKEKELFKNGH